MMDDLKRVKRNKIILILAVVGIVVLCIAATIFAVINRESDYTEPESDFGELIGDKKNKFVVFYKNNILTDIYGLEVSSRIMENFEEFVLSDEEMEFSRNNSPIEDDAEMYYDATIDMGNLSAYDAYTTKFEVTVSDERKYEVLVQSNSLDRDTIYVYVAIARDGGDEITLFVNGDNVDENEFVDFAKKELGKNSAKIIQKEL